MIEGSVIIAEHELLVQDEQLMIFVPGGEGGSVPLDFDVLKKLDALVGLAHLHHDQMRRKAEDPYPYPDLQPA